MTVSLFGYWGLGMTSSVVLAFTLGMDGPGIWIGLVSGLAIVSVLLYVRWLRRERLMPWLHQSRVA
ncbi:MATE efflux family protein [Nitratireductor aquibiodomus RA22]|uniref:MATE efflux family protein n=1 Tax=Nitratireductor aquibiodomus RA22 TaxID=1189611 RepID=I5BTM6_9HYPH|nr:hypothetical protein [Nitratireductor aquibiodomus]EIM72928.1 MATE efflux family protein [Nitratireductor aquibiodomus RA22]